MLNFKRCEILRVVFFVGFWNMCTSNKNPGSDADIDEEWMYFTDEFGNIHVLNYSTLHINLDGFVLGDVYFSLYTRRNAHNPENLTIPADDSSFNSKYLNDLNPIIALTHGWLSDDKTGWLQDIRNSFLKKTDLNIITVNWGELAENPVYQLAALSTRYVGKILAKLLDSITESTRLKGKDLYLIGHSLGAHVMGYTGMFSNQRIARITGLDPARPLFEFPPVPPEFRLERSDAEFVDIIHTCGGGLGYKYSYGDADFYPNNGTFPQPGCEGFANIIQGCSHLRACLLYNESIGYESGGFVSYPCHKWKRAECECNNKTQLMGYPLSLDARGDYCLRTRSEPEYAISEE